MNRPSVVLAVAAVLFVSVDARASRVRAELTCPIDGQTPLTCAASQGRTGLVDKFLKARMPVGQVDRFGATALHWAALGGHGDTVKFLLDHHADVNASNRRGGTPLHWVAKTRHWRVAELLLSRGARVDAFNGDGWTPLMTAAQSDDGEVARILLGYGANVGLRNPAGQTAADLAAAAHHDGLARMIAGLGAPSKPGKPAAAPASAPAAAPAQTVSKDELARMIAEAVAQAQKAPAKPVYHSDADRPTYQISPNPDDYALVIGIENYSDLPQAQFAQRDAQAVRAHLVALGYPERNVVLLTGAKATKTGVLKNVETWLPANVNEKSTVFVYYSGHGAPDVKTGKSYLVPWDGDPQFLEDTAYPVSRLYEKLGALKAKRVIVALDSCFSGTGGRSVLAKGLRPLVLKADEGLPGKGKVVAFAASAGDQASGSEEKQGHGLFTYYLLSGLNAQHGTATARSLFDYLSPRVQDAARRQNRDQKPQLAADGPAAASALR